MENFSAISVKDLGGLLEKMKKRLAVSNHAEQTIVNYLRAVEYLCKHTGKNPADTDIDEVTDYQLQYHKLRAWQTIEEFSQNPVNRVEAKMGMIAILHTWKQNLDYHPHLHCIIPSGGITAIIKWKSSPNGGDYLFNYEALAKTFKGKFMFYLKSYYKEI